MFGFQILSLIVLNFLTLANGAYDYPEAILLINNEYRKSDAEKGQANLSQSQSLTEDAEVAQNSLGDFEGDPYGSRIVLRHFMEPSVTLNSPEILLKLAIEKFAEYAGRKKTRLNQKQTIFSREQGSVEYNTGSIPIGSGNHGDVLLAKPVAGNSPLIIMKKPTYPSSVETITALTEEAKALAEIGDNPGIVKMLQAGVPDDGSGYAVLLEMLLADLHEMMTLCGKNFTLKTSILIAKQLIEAVRHVHSKDYVHRDIKVENIMVALVDGKYKVKLIDFGLAGRYRTNGVLVTESSGARGTIETMSPDAHFQKPLRPRDDIWSIMCTFMLFVHGSLAWDSQCDQIEKLCNDRAKFQNLAIVASIDEEIAKISFDVAKLKITKIKELYGKYPELKPLVDQLLDDTELDYDMMQECFDALLDRHNIINDGVLDWQERLQLLLENSSLLNIGIGIAYRSGWCTIFLLEKFFVSVVDDLKINGNDVRVLKDLCNEATLQYNPELFGNIWNYFQTTVNADEIKHLRLSHFRNSEVAKNLVKFHGIVYAGIGYYYDASQRTYKVSIILKGIAEVVEMNKRINVTDLMGFETAKENPEAAMFLRKLLKTPKLETYQVVNSEIAKTQEFLGFLTAAFKSLNDFVVRAINRKDLIELGYPPRSLPNDSTQVSHQEVYAFRWNYNFVNNFKAVCSTTNQNMLSWSADESVYDNTELSAPLQKNIATSSKSKSSSSASKANLVVPVEDNHNYAQEFKVPEKSSQFAIRSELIRAIKRPLMPGLWNIRFQWIWNPDGEYSVMVIQDSFYLLAAKVYMEKNELSSMTFSKYQNKWELKDAGQMMHQRANDEALEAILSPNAITMHDQQNGTIVFGLETIPNDSVKERILNNINSLNSFDTNENLLKINPHDVSSVTYGYGITASGSVKGVSIYETYCYEALQLINNCRNSLKPNKLPPLKLHPQNYELAEEYRKNYKRSGFLKSLSCNGGSRTTDDSQVAAKVSFRKETTKEALSSYVANFLSKPKDPEYNKVTNNRSTKISFVIFQSRVGGKWKIYIGVYG